MENKKLNDAIKDLYIFFKQCEFENKYSEQLTDHFLKIIGDIRVAVEDYRNTIEVLTDHEKCLENENSSLREFKDAVIEQTEILDEGGYEITFFQDDDNYNIFDKMFNTKRVK